MIPNEFFIDVADFSADRAAIATVREPVFEQEQQVPSDVVWDDLDPRCWHVLARTLDGTPIGCGRLTPQHSIGRLAVVSDWRGRGVGRAMMQTLIDTARGRHYPAVEVHSQVHAIPFYEELGFVSVGESYMEAGIPHQTMRLDLSSESLERDAPPKGKESPEIEFSNLQQAREIVLTVLKAAHRQLWIYTRDLDPDLFQGEAVMQELRRIATAGRGAEIQIILHDLESAQRHGGGLLALAQRLSSTVSIRRPEDEVELQFAGAYVINDNAGMMSRPLASRYEGAAREHGPGNHRKLRDHFRHAWERAAPASELRAQGM